jgi:HEAT repeat protein
LLQALTNKTPYVRLSAALALSSLHQFAQVPETNKAVSAFLTACRITPEELHRNSTVFATAAVPSLLLCLNDSDPGVRQMAVISLDEMGVRPTNALPILISNLGSWEAITRKSSALRLGHYGKLAEPAVPALIGLLNDSEESVRRAALRALKEIDSEAADKLSLER